jgi:cytochrome c-type biogenesis protein CcmH
VGVRRPLLLLLAALGGAMSLAAASDPAERLKDPAKEARAHALFREIRCVQCQSESIDDSEASMARDFRQIVREQVAEGRSDPEIKRWFRDRYGEFVLLRPSFGAGNVILWLLPFVAALGGGAVIVFYVRRRGREAEAALTEEEEAKLKDLMTRHAFAATWPQENTEDDLSVR